MSRSDNEVKIKVGAQGTQQTAEHFHEMAEKIEADLKAIRERSMAGGGFLGIGIGAEKLRAQYMGSGANAVTHLLEGRGALLGINIMSRMLAEAAKSVKEVAEGLREGSMSAGEMADKLVGGLPIIGQFWQAGRSLHEAIFGAGVDFEKVKKEAAETEEITRKIAENIRRGNRAGLPFGEREEAGIEDKYTSRAANRESALKAAQDDLDAAIEQARRSLGGDKGATNEDVKKYFLEVDTPKIVQDAFNKLKNIRDINHSEEVADEKERNATLHDIAVKRMRDSVSAKQKENEDLQKLYEEAYQKDEERRKKESESEVKSQQAINDAINDAQVKRLESQQKFGEAKLAELEYQHQKTLKKILDETNEEAKLYPENSLGIAHEQTQRIAAENERHRAEVAKANEEERTRQNSLADHRANVDKQLGNARLEYLKAEYEAGRSVLKNEIDRLEIADKFIDRQKVLTDILNDQKSTDDQKAAARRNLAALPLLQQLELLQRQSGDGVFTPSARTEESRHLTGLSRAAEQAQYNRQNADNIKKLTDQLDQILQFVNNQPTPTVYNGAG